MRLFFLGVAMRGAMHLYSGADSVARWAFASAQRIALRRSVVRRWR